jgi:hypothetical protein
MTLCGACFPRLRKRSAGGILPAHAPPIASITLGFPTAPASLRPDRATFHHVGYAIAPAFDEARATTEDVPMIVDVVGWIILACAIAFIAAGCIYTRPAPEPVKEAFQDKIDRAA